jgi:D-lactate dehydrogenase (cytochrome)
MIIKTNQDEIQNFLSDAANFKGNCEAVYLPENEEEIISIIKEANSSNIQVTVSGNGTGLTGARVPQEGIVISLEKLNKIKEINFENRFTIVQPGVLLSKLQNEVNFKKLLYPPDPTEKECFIGATIATNASGAKSFKYGPTRNFVEELRIVLPTGDLLKLKRGNIFAEGYDLKLTTETGKDIEIKIPNYKMPQTKNAAGYYCIPNMDAIDLFIGSEGTLGIFTEIKLKLVSLPENILSSVVFFENENNSLMFIKELRELSIKNRNEQNDSDINALGLEFFDKNALNFLHDDFPNIPQNAEAAVWFEQDITSAQEERIFERIIHFIKKYNGDDKNSWYAANEKDHESFNNFRHAVSYKVSEFITHNNVMKVGTDTAVPAEKFNDFYAYSKEIVRSSKLAYLCYGHFGDCHFHLNMLPNNNEEYEKAKKLYSSICKKAVDFGGTISAEHGIGKLKTDYLLLMYGEQSIRQMARIKKVLDSNKILGLGNIFTVNYLD